MFMSEGKSRPWLRSQKSGPRTWGEVAFSRAFRFTKLCSVKVTWGWLERPASRSFHWPFLSLFLYLETWQGKASVKRSQIGTFPSKITREKYGHWRLVIGQTAGEKCPQSFTGRKYIWNNVHLMTSLCSELHHTKVFEECVTRTFRAETLFLRECEWSRICKSFAKTLFLPSTRNLLLQGVISKFQPWHNFSERVFTKTCLHFEVQISLSRNLHNHQPPLIAVQNGFWLLSIPKVTSLTQASSEFVLFVKSV